MWDIKVGDLCVCIDANTHGWEKHVKGADAIRKGEIYTVRGIVICPVSKELGLYVEEILLPLNKFSGIEFGYDIKNFRPVSRLRSEEFCKLVAPIKESLDA